MGDRGPDLEDWIVGEDDAALGDRPDVASETQTGGRLVERVNVSQVRQLAAAKQNDSRNV